MTQEVGVSKNTAYISLALLYGVAVMSALFIVRRSGWGTLAWSVVLALFFGAAESGRKKWFSNEEETE